MDPATSPPTERRIADRYRLGSVLGRGGMGVVWAAHDEVLNREVAVKEVLPAPGLTTEQLVEMRESTVREARTAARLSSPAVVLVYDVVEQAGEPWIVMERLAPRTLADVLDHRGRLAPTEVATLGLRLLDALDAAHRADVLHRDVKPSNVMFRGQQGMASAVLTDFGIARFVGDPNATATGTLIGSPAFVAPERARGERASPASDLWSLGVTLWIAAEGVSPFHREGTLQTLTAVLTQDLPPIQYAGPLAPALSGLLRKDPARRLDSRHVRTLLERVVARAVRAAKSAEATAVLPTISAPAGATPQGAPLPTPAPTLRPTPLPTPAPTPLPAPRPTPWPDGTPVRQSRRGVVAATLAALLVLGLAAYAVTSRGDAEPSTGDAAPKATGAPPHPTGSVSATASVSPSPAATPRSTAAATSTRTPATPSATTSTVSTPPGTSTLPAGLRRYTDVSGFSVGVPAGWTADRSGRLVYLRDPRSSAYLLVDQTRRPAADPLADWQAQEAVRSKRIPNYRLIRIDPMTVRGWKGADWEFTRGGGTHVLNRNLVTAPDQAYALYWSAPDNTWPSSERLFDQVTASFQPRS